MDDYTARQREAFANALADALPDDYDERTRIAGEIGYSSVGSLTNWAQGKAPPKPPVVTRLELALGLEPGHLSQHLGWTPLDADAPDCTVESAIAADPRLSTSARRVLRSVYRELTQAEGR